jgi:hypothetical protein
MPFTYWAVGIARTGESLYLSVGERDVAFGNLRCIQERLRQRCSHSIRTSIPPYWFGFQVTIGHRTRLEGWHPIQWSRRSMKFAVLIFASTLLCSCQSTQQDRAELARICADHWSRSVPDPGNIYFDECQSLYPRSSKQLAKQYLLYRPQGDFR